KAVDVDGDGDEALRLEDLDQAPRGAGGDEGAERHRDDAEDGPGAQGAPAAELQPAAEPVQGAGLRRYDSRLAAAEPAQGRRRVDRDLSVAQDRGGSRRGCCHCLAVAPAPGAGRRMGPVLLRHRLGLVLDAPENAPARVTPHAPTSRFRRASARRSTVPTCPTPIPIAWATA